MKTFFLCKIDLVETEPNANNILTLSNIPSLSTILAFCTVVGNLRPGVRRDPPVHPPPALGTLSQSAGVVRPVWAPEAQSLSSNSGSVLLTI